MINPYQVTPNKPEDHRPTGPGEELRADFQLLRGQISGAESRFLLYRYGIRLTIASLAILGLTVYISVTIMHRLSATPPGVWDPIYAIVVVIIAELLVMGLAIAVYQSLIWSARKELRQHLKSNGVVANASIQLSVNHDELVWSSPTGVHRYPLNSVQLLNTRAGLCVATEPRGFVLVPRKSNFNGFDYSVFFDKLAALVKQRRATDAREEGMIQ